MCQTWLKNNVISIIIELLKYAPRGSMHLKYTLGDFGPLWSGSS